jgi:hypothetical protein
MSRFKNDGVLVQEYVYDFAVDGGAQGEIFLSAKANAQPIPNGAIVKGVTMKVVTAFTSGGSATLAWGNDDDPDGYSGAAIAVASLTDNAVFNGWDNGAALIWDDSNDHAIYNPVINADDGDFSVTIGTADMTAGKAVFLVEYYSPSLE